MRYTQESPAEGPPLVRERICILALLVAVGIFHAATVRQGHIWSDDFAMYVHHAQNIVEGRPYIATGYIYNPSFPVYGPKFYPPIFPVLLAPVYRSFGLNLIPMKLEQVLFLVLALIAVYAYWRRDLGPGYTLALVALLGFNPEFWLAKDNVLSDIPFLFFFYLTALLVRSARRDGLGWWRWSAWLWPAMIGVVIYLAIGTRAVGIALLAGLLFYDVLRLRTITRFTAVSVAVCAVFLVLQPRIMGFGPDGYSYQRPTLHTIAVNIAAYARVLASFWVGSAPHAFAYVVLGLFSAFALGGLVIQSRRGFTFVETALAAYFAIILLWPFPAGVRMVFPVVPWIGYLALSGCKGLTEKMAYATPRLRPRCCFFLSPSDTWSFIVASALARFVRRRGSLSSTKCAMRCAPIQRRRTQSSTSAPARSPFTPDGRLPPTTTGAAMKSFGCGRNTSTPSIW